MNKTQIVEQVKEVIIKELLADVVISIVFLIYILRMVIKISND